MTWHEPFIPDANTRCVWLGKKRTDRMGEEVSTRPTVCNKTSVDLIQSIKVTCLSALPMHIKCRAEEWASMHSGLLLLRGMDLVGVVGIVRSPAMSSSSRSALEGNVEAEEAGAEDAAVRNRFSSARNCEFSVDKVSISRPS